MFLKLFFTKSNLYNIYYTKNIVNYAVYNKKTNKNQITDY